jgi:hypothetical protein
LRENTQLTAYLKNPFIADSGWPGVIFQPAGCRKIVSNMNEPEGLTGYFRRLPARSRLPERHKKVSFFGIDKPLQEE